MYVYSNLMFLSPPWHPGSHWILFLYVWKMDWKILKETTEN